MACVTLQLETRLKIQERMDNKHMKREGTDRRLPAREIVLLVLSSPIWIAVFISGFAVMFSFYVVIWAAIISLWAAEASFVAGSFGSIVMGVWAFCQGDGLQGILMLSAAAVLAGLSIFLFFGCKKATHNAVRTTKKIVLWIKSQFLRGNA